MAASLTRAAKATKTGWSGRAGAPLGRSPAARAAKDHPIQFSRTAFWPQPSPGLRPPSPARRGRGATRLHFSQDSVALRCPSPRSAGRGSSRASAKNWGEGTCPLRTCSNSDRKLPSRFVAPRPARRGEGGSSRQRRTGVRGRALFALVPIPRSLPRNAPTDFGQILRADKKQAFGGRMKALGDRFEGVRQAH